MSQYQQRPHQTGAGEPLDRDPAERLATALGRIAIAVERREAMAAEAEAAGMQAMREVEASAAQARQDAEGASTALQEATATPEVDVPVLVANLDALIVRLRDVLGESAGQEHPADAPPQQGWAP